MKKTIITLCFLFSVQTWAANLNFKQIKPLIDKYCIDCHGPDKAKAKLRMDKLNPDIVAGPDAEMWQEALDLLNISDMPPAEAKKQPTRQERQLMVSWLTRELRLSFKKEVSSGGRNMIRRLTAYEYDNTLKDLLGLDVGFAGDIPPEGTAKEGFKNNHTVLNTSPIHIEYFEKIAREGLEKVIMIDSRKPEKYSMHVEPEWIFSNSSDFKKLQVSVKSKKGKSAEKKKKSDKKKKNADKKKKNADKKKKGKANTLRSEPVLESTSSNSSKTETAGVRFKKAPENISNKTALLAIYAEKAANGVLLAGEPDKVEGKLQIKGVKKGHTDRPNVQVHLLEVPTNHPIRVRVKAAAVSGKGGIYPRLTLRLGAYKGGGVVIMKDAADIEIRNSISEPQVYEFIVRPENFPFIANKIDRPQYIEVRNGYRRGTGDLDYNELPKLFVDSIDIEANYYETWPPKSYHTVMGKFTGDEQGKVLSILKSFVSKAYRRQAEQSEIDFYFKLFQQFRKQDGAFKPALVSTLTAVLCSPYFLHIVEPVTDSNSKRKLTDYELATRLSYFLWSSMPDNTLFRLASQNKLSDPQVLTSQVSRMLNDPKSKNFVENFTRQWLDLDALWRVNINPEHFKIDSSIKDSFEQETINFVGTVLKENLSITNFVDSNFAILNPEMLSYYKVKGFSGGGFMKIPLKPSDRRGGLLTQASILLGNSTGADSHPIKRGVWLLERILNSPPPPPPPVVPELPEPDENSSTVLTLKERLKKHAELESCRDCHTKIDPWGIAFENYNAVGLWREGNSDPHAIGKYKNVKSDPSTTLKNGTDISDLKHLKKYILTERKGQFVRAVIDKVLAYSIGRYTEFSDQSTINETYEKLKSDNYKFQNLIKYIVLSEPFLTK